VWARLRHPHILPLVGICTLTDDMTYMISPWMHHGDIQSYLKRHPDVDRLSLLVQVGEGLEYLHTKSIVHGDVRGPNVLISESGEACLADFGLSKPDEQGLYSYSTKFHTSGNQRWMAPELLLNETVRTTTTDVFSFGRLIIEVLTGEHPFPDLNEYQAISPIVKGALPNRPTGKAVARGLDNTVWALVKDCCSFKPHRRPTISVVLSRLRAHIALLPLKQDVPSYSVSFHKFVIFFLVGAVISALYAPYAFSVPL